MAENNSYSHNPVLGQPLIPVINKLQDILSQLGGESVIDLPQVAVVGSQSSGKSSVLEALVGRDFLPRGSDICTRRPLVLQLIQISRSDESDFEEWGEFSHLPGRRFADFSAIRREIQAETEREVGVNKGISDKQIRLKIFSPYVLSINLVDLPGIMKVPVGDQPIDIEDRIRTMIMSYIKHPSCIILAVSPANSDLANSDALQIARIADTDGSRTIGVITKLDIMDRGTDAQNFLLGKLIPLRLGYVGVVNRSQEDILGNKSVRDALAYEEQFFHSHPVYRDLATQCGILQLAKKLNQILQKHIRVMLPDLKANIYAQMMCVKKELSSYGEVTECKIDKGSLLLSILRRFSDAFISAIEGKNEEMAFELVGGARLHHIFQSVFFKRLEEVDPCEGLSDKDIQTAIQNATGFKSAIFVPEVPFQLLVRRKISQLLDPSLQCVHIIYDELVKLAHRCQTSELRRFPELRRCVEEVLGSCLREGLVPALTMVEHLIEMEMDYINTSHPSFIGGSKAMVAATQQQRSPVGSMPAPKSKMDHNNTLPASFIGGNKAMAAATQQERYPMGSVAASKAKETADFNREPATDKVLKSPSILARASPSRFFTNHVIRHDKFGANGYTFRGSWGISSIFELGESIASLNSGNLIPSANGEKAISSPHGREAILSTNGGDAIPSDSGREEITSVNDSNLNLFANCSSSTKENVDPVYDMEHVHGSSIIHLKEPPTVLRPTEAQTQNVAIGVTATKILVRSYYDIVRKNIQDRVPKTIMHFLVNHAKRKLNTILIQNLYREDLFPDMFREREDIAVRRKQCKDILGVLQQAVSTLDELPLD